MKQFLKIYLSLFMIFAGCNFSCRNGQVESKQIGSYRIEARFINDTIIDGVAYYYDTLNNLSSVVNYKMGVKDGYALNYYLNGRISDSIYYVNGLRHGRSFRFDSLGNLLFEKQNYFGLSIGPSYYYVHGYIAQYNYVNFEKDDLVICKYDSMGKCLLVRYDVQPITSEVFDSNQTSSLNVFLYLSRPPKLEAEYKIGLENELHEKRDEMIINNNTLFLDTLLPNPEKGWHYFISAHLKSQTDSINKLFFHELRVNSIK